MAEREIDVRRTALEDIVIRAPFKRRGRLDGRPAGRDDLAGQRRRGALRAPASAPSSTCRRSRSKSTSTRATSTGSRPHARGCDVSAAARAAMYPVSPARAWLRRQRRGPRGHVPGLARTRVVATLDASPTGRFITTIPAADRQRATVLMRTALHELGDSRLLGLDRFGRRVHGIGVCMIGLHEHMSR